MKLVEREESARDELADVWVLATPEERVRIEGIVLSVEQDLADDADRVGEFRFDRVRVASPGDTERRLRVTLGVLLSEAGPEALAESEAGRTQPRPS